MVIHPGKLLKLNLPICEDVEVEEHLGSGGFGDVYKVRDISTEKFFALKHVRLNKAKTPKKQFKVLMRTLEEAKITFDSPYIVKNFGLAHVDEYDIIILGEYIDGLSLDQWIEANYSQPWNLKKNLFLQILEGVRTAHEKGIVHRDLKPHNIIVTKDNEPKILDFGLAKTKDKNITATSDMATGTLPYMAPESFLPHKKTSVDHRFDIYSLGCILYEIIRGKNYCDICDFHSPPFGEFMHKDELRDGDILKFDKDFTHPDKNVITSIKTATQFKPEKRFNNIDEFYATLSKGKPRPTIADVESYISANKHYQVLLAIICIILLLASIYIVFGQKSKSVNNEIHNQLPNREIYNKEQTKEDRVLESSDFLNKSYDLIFTDVSGEERYALLQITSIEKKSDNKLQLLGTINSPTHRENIDGNQISLIVNLKTNDVTFSPFGTGKLSKSSLQKIMMSSNEGTWEIQEQ